MFSRLRIAALLLFLCGTFAGCGFDPFRRCDNRPSLADWLDENGPLGCNCNHGQCRNGNCRCCR